MQQIMLDCGDRYIADLRKRVRQQPNSELEINLNSEMKNLTLNMLTETIFGFEASKELQDAMAIIGKDFGLALLVWSLPLVGKLLPNPKLKALLAARETVFQIVDDLLKERLAKAAKGNASPPPLSQTNDESKHFFDFVLNI